MFVTVLEYKYELRDKGLIKDIDPANGAVSLRSMLHFEEKGLFGYMRYISVDVQLQRFTGYIYCNQVILL